MSAVVESLIRHEEAVEWLDEDLGSRLLQVCEHAKANPQLGVLDIVHSLMKAEWDLVLEAEKSRHEPG
jgi:hypothetical protein